MQPNYLSVLRKIAYREDLTSEEARNLLTTLGLEDEITDSNHSDGMYFLALTFGIMAKGPTADELLGFVMSISDQSVKFETRINPDQLIDVSGTGGDKIKTFNIGTAVSFVIAAGGANVAKQATRGYTGFTGSADIYKEVGSDPFTIERNSVVRCLEETGLVAFYTPAFTGAFKNRIDFLIKLKAIGLSYPTPWHLVSWVYSPFKMSARVYGVFDQRYVGVLGRLFLKLGYKRAMVVHGVDGLDEISNIGETVVAEVVNGEVKEYSIVPSDYGIPTSNRAEIQTLTDQELAMLHDSSIGIEEKKELEERGKRNNLESFLRVLYGKETGARRDIVLMNAGAALYLCGIATTPKEGVELSRSLIENGKVREKLLAYAEFAGSTVKLHKWEDEFGLR